MNATASLMTLSKPARRAPIGNPGKAIAYVRASTAKQAASPAAQLGAIRAWAKAQGIAIVEVFRDEATSGDADLEDRPGILAAVEAIRTQGAGLLLVAKRDRLARDGVIAGLLERLVQKAGGKVASADGLSIAGDGPEATLLRGILDLFAQFEVGVIRARTKGALAHRKAAGLRVGGIPFGYRLAGDGRSLVEDVAEQKVLSTIKRLRRSRSWRSVVGELHRRGVVNRSGRCAWSVGQVQRLLRVPSGG